MSEKLGATWVELLRRLAPLLSTDLFDRLRTSALPILDAGQEVASSPSTAERRFGTLLHEAITSLDSLHHKLATFFPRYLLELAPTPGQPHGERLGGTFIFADVTGFTALTGELSRRGSEGLEEMNRLMRDLFGALLDPLLTSGGDLIMFAGDAALAYLPARPEGQDARWATRTALRLVEAIRPFRQIETPYGTFSLTMSAGVERGDCFAAVVGTRQRMELLISGGPVQSAMATEALAEPGEVAIGPNIRPFVQDEFVIQGNIVRGVRGGELTDYEPVLPTRRRGRLSALLSRRIPDLLQDLEQALERVEGLVPFISPTLFAQIARGEDFRQHPPVAIQFVNILGIEELALGPAGPEQATAVLQRYFVQAQEIVAEREGIVNQMVPYAKGFVLLNPFGAPTHHEGVPRLAASAALELASTLEQVNEEFGLDPPLAQRTGMAYDRIFTGEIGYLHRREYVVAGPSVNLAARLMGKADPGQIVLDPAAWEAVEEDFSATPLLPIPLKGIAKPVPRFALDGLQRGKDLHATDYPVVGRRRELAVVDTLLDEAVAGRGTALALVGAPGMGKNYLAVAIAGRARDRGMTVLTGRCHAFTQNVPYKPWAGLVGQLFQLDTAPSPKIRRQRLQGWLAHFELAPYFPAFADLLDLQATQLDDRITPTSQQGPSLFAALQRQAQRGETGAWELAALLSERTADTGGTPEKEAGPSIWELLQERASIPRGLHALLERQAAQKPTLVVIEDLQWMDPDSRQVLERVAAAARQWALFLLVTARPGSAWAGDRIALPPLVDADSEALAGLALRATRLAPDLSAWLLERTKGNPLFVTTYCKALRHASAVVVDPATGEARWSGPPPPLPLSLQELLLAQVNQLDKQGREMVQRGAVIGDTMPAWLLSRLCQGVLSANQLTTALEQAARRSFIAPPPPAQTYIFSSQSLHDAVYTALAHALRRSWHEQTGDLLTEADEATRYERLEQIAYHYSHSGNALKAAHFTRLAGDKARARQADEAALAFYAQTLGVSGDDAALAAEHRLAHEGSGDVHALRGEWTHAQAAYRAALPGAEPETAARLTAKLALLSPLTGPADPTVLTAARQALPPSSPLQSWLGAALCQVHAERGEASTARALGQELLPQAREPVSTLLREILQAQEDEATPHTYKELCELYARSNLRRGPGGEV